MSFFKRLIPLKGKVWIDLDRPGFQEGEDVAGKVNVEAREFVQGTEVRVEARAFEDWSELVWVERGNPPQKVQERQSRVDTRFSQNVQVSGPADFGMGPTRGFPFKVNIPPSKPVHEGGSVRYAVKGVVAVKGRPDMTGETNISFVPAVPVLVQVASGVGGAASAQPLVIPVAATFQRAPEKVRCEYCEFSMDATESKCPNCGAPR
jgi:hypothetical protein